MIAPTEMALKYNWVLKTMSKDIVTEPGLNFIGVGVSVIRYPKTIMNLEFTKDQHHLMDGRTKDGLKLFVGLSFQYQLIPEELLQLYYDFEQENGDYLKIFGLAGIHICTEVSTKYSAYEFFGEKQAIAEDMQAHLDRYFKQHLHARVLTLQINEDDPPQAFTDMILVAATKKQKIARMRKVLKAQLVSFKMNQMVAEKQANMTILQASGQNYTINNTGEADSKIIEVFVSAEKEKYAQVKEKMDLDDDALIKYMWYDTLAGGGIGQNTTKHNDVSMLVGVNPAAYIAPSSNEL